MIKFFFMIISLILFVVNSNAWAVSPIVQETAAIKLAKEWQNKRIKPILSPEGKIIYCYGATAVTVKTKTYHSTDIELETGETIEHIDAGDSIRWKITPAYHGSGNNKTLHIFIKPIDTGLKTNLTILTNKRAYRFDLQSSSKEHMSIVGFEYPKRYQDIVAKLKIEHELQKAKEVKRSLPNVEDLSERLSIAALDFNYIVDGDKTSWHPIRVYNDGVKTIIELPEKAKYTKIPVLSVLDDSNKKAIVNYRLLNNIFVVDMLFNKAILVSGVGGEQTKVTIDYKGE